MIIKILKDNTLKVLIKHTVMKIIKILNLIMLWKMIIQQNKASKNYWINNLIKSLIKKIVNYLNNNNNKLNI